MNPISIQSKDNPLVKRLRQLAQAPMSEGDAQWVLIEGEHLCAAAHARGLRAQPVALAESAARGSLHDLAQLLGDRVVVMPDALMRSISSLPSPAPIAAVLRQPLRQPPQGACASVVLDRVQDAGNVGSILRSAAAFGIKQVLAISGTARLWSPKVVRSGMGAHFGLRLCEGLRADEVIALGLPLVGTSSHAGQELHQADLPSPCAWLFGHEGQGVVDELERAAQLQVRIAQPGGEESLNVAAAAAVCLYVGSLPRAPARTHL